MSLTAVPLDVVKLSRALVLVIAVAGLAGCGGGGGGGGGGTGVTDVTVSGTVTFDKVPHGASGGLDYNATTAAPARGVIVEILSVATGGVLASTTTNSAGNYAMSVAPDTQVRVRVIARMRKTGAAPVWDAYVADNTAGDAVYAMDSTSFDTGNTDQTRNMRAESGWGGAGYTGERAAGPFAILDGIYDAIDTVLEVDPDAIFPPLELNWSPLNTSCFTGTLDPASGCIISTLYTRQFGLPEIYVLGDEDNDTDEYDPHVVVHEFGHYLEDQLGRSDSIGGSHSLSDRLDFRVAFSEGWSNAFSAIVLEDPIYKDAFGFRQAAIFAFDVESNSQSVEGWYSEGSVQSILYDVYDDAPDGVDSVALGFGPIFDAITGGHATTTAVTSIYTFMEALDVGSSAAGISDLLMAQDIVSLFQLDPFAENETNDANNDDVLPVYEELVVDGGTVEVCSIDDFGVFNKLSVSRFLRFDVPSSGNYVVLATAAAGEQGISDPDIAVFDQGFLRAFESFDIGVEQGTISLDPGVHVLEVYEFSNTTGSPRGRTCFDVSVSSL